MLKKILSLFLAVLLCMTAVACKSDNTTEDKTTSSSESTLESEDTTKDAPETKPENEKVDLGPDASELLPAYEGINAEIDFTDTYNSCTLMTVQDTTQADYEAYISKFTTYSNYTEIVAPRDILDGTGNIASMYTKETENGTYLINALWIPAERSIYGVGQVKVSIEPLNDKDLSVFDPASATTGQYDSLIIMIGQDDITEDGTDANVVSHAMSFAQRLSDGSFLLFDGGGKDLGTSTRDIDRAARIYETLKKYSPTEEIVISGWYFSHPHVDHMGGFVAFANYYINNPSYNITLKNVIGYLPNVKTQTYVDEGGAYSLTPEKINTYNACFEKLRANGTNIHKAHVGQKFYFADTTLEVLFSYDLLTPKLPDAVFTNNAYIRMKEYGALQNTEGSGTDFTNSFSVIIQVTTKVDKDTSYKAIWTGDATCFGIETVNSMYGFAMKSDFVQVMHHGSIQMINGTESDPLIKYYHKIQANHFFGAVSGISQENYTTDRFGEYFKSDGSYGYVQAKYILMPASIAQSTFFDDLDNANPNQDISANNTSHLNGWDPRYHLQDEARAAGGDLYLARCFLTVFTLGKTVTVTKDYDVIKTPMPTLVGGTAITSVADLANMESDGIYFLANDITVTDPTGPLFSGNFAGVLDGNGYTITAVYNKLSATPFNMSAGSGFLFANLYDGATVKNLTISGVRMAIGSVANQYGVLARRTSGTVLIENVHVKNATITEQTASNSNIGGFVGDVNAKASLTIKDSSFDGTITTPHTIGGLIGRAGTSKEAAKSVTIKNCTVSGELNCTGDQVGGFIGLCNVSDSCLIQNSTCQATVKGGDLASGFIATVNGATPKLESCKLTGTVTGKKVGDWAASGTVTTVNCTKD